MEEMKNGSETTHVNHLLTARMTKREYIRRYTKAAGRIAEAASRPLPKNQRSKYVRDCETIDRLQGESNADKLSKGKNSDDKMKKSLRLIEKQGLVHGLVDDDGSIPIRPIHPSMRKFIDSMPRKPNTTCEVLSSPTQVWR